MQGFNKYYPPDYDGEKHGSLNSYRGKHALGDRARKISQGILIVRFELPFNIWCGTCNSHIGMGVRYNAEKKKIGSYYSTPIYSFRCKCHLCSGWFEIQTDPKQTRYIVTSGARQKDEDWDPEANGGFAIHDTEGKAGPSDPLAALEKTTDAQNHAKNVQIPRLEALQIASDTHNEDPYTHSLRVRKRFRTEKKAEKVLEAADDQLKGQYALPTELKLLRDDEGSRAAAKQEWERAKAQVQLRESVKRKRDLVAPKAIGISSRASGSGSSSALASLRTRILENTAKQRPLKPPENKH